MERDEIAAQVEAEMTPIATPSSSLSSSPNTPTPIYVPVPTAALHQSSPPTSPVAKRQPSIIVEANIQDTEGKRFWEEFIGTDTVVEWKRFMDAADKFLKTKISLTEEKILQHLIDNSQTGFVSQYKFSEFLKGFGPFSMCIKNAKETLSEKWFQGFLTNREAELLLKDEPEGCFLIRFSKSKPGSFALAFKGKGYVNHILIYSNKPHGFKVYETQSRILKEYNSLADIIKFYSFVLKMPYSASLPKERWFQGDMNGEETEEVLEGQPVGTFLIRFSSSGDLAASFVDVNKQVKHSLITKQNGVYKIRSDTQTVLEFQSVRDLVAHFTSIGVFKNAYKNLSSIFIEERPASKRTQIMTQPPNPSKTAYYSVNVIPQQFQQP